ncbi:MAG TPA: hypothetical protein VGD58_20930 [Herpetosiphonaceae bacterium]
MIRLHATKIAFVTLLGCVFVIWMAMPLGVPHASAYMLWNAAAQPEEAVHSHASQAITPTPIVSATATVTPTAVYPPSLQDIQNALNPELEEIQRLLAAASQSSASSLAGNIGQEMISNVLWELFGSPLLTQSLTFLGSLSIIGKLFTRYKINKETSSGQTPSTSITQLDTLFNVLILICMVIFIFLFFYFSVNVPSQAEIATPIDVAAVNSKLDRIETQLQDLLETQVVTPTVAPLLPTPTPTSLPIIVNPPGFEPDSSLLDEPAPGVTGTMLFFSGLFLATLILIALWILKYIRSSRNVRFDTATTGATIQVSGLPIDTGVLAAILLALIIMLLPYPADIFLLPVIVPYLVLTFFELVILYPSVALKAFINRRYSLFVFLAVFGSWASLFEVISYYLSPIWGTFPSFITEVFFSSAGVENMVSREIVRSFLANSIPLILALIVAIPGSIRLRKSVLQNIIPRLRHAIENGKIVQ